MIGTEVTGSAAEYLWSRCGDTPSCVPVSEGLLYLQGLCIAANSVIVVMILFTIRTERKGYAAYGKGIIGAFTDG